LALTWTKRRIKMSDQGQGNENFAPPKEVAAEDVGKTKVMVDEFFGQGREANIDKCHRLPTYSKGQLGKVVRTPEEEEAYRQEIEAEVVAKRAEIRTEQRKRDARWVRDMGFGHKSADMGDVEEHIRKMEQSAKGIVEMPSLDEIADAVIVELAKRLLPEHFEVRNTKTDRTPEEIGAAISKVAKRLWTDWVDEREQLKATEPHSRRYHHQAVTSTLQIPVEEDE
jgi:hypothetical protein